MRVVGHAIDCNQFLALPRYDSRDVFLQLLSTRNGNCTRATGHRENNMQINLRVGVGHLVSRLICRS